MRDKNIYLVFTKTGTWLSRLIYVFSNIKYAHASISLDDSFTNMYSFGRTNPDNPFSGGFVVESLKEGVYKKFRESECMIYKVSVTEEQYYSLQTLLENFIQNRNQMRYNFLGLWGVWINLRLYRKNYYFCSQFVSELLIKSNILDWHKAPELTRTDELFSIKNKELIYEGFVHSHGRYSCLKAAEG
jgi:hypothetical protein